MRETEWERDTQGRTRWTDRQRQKERGTEMEKNVRETETDTEKERERERGREGESKKKHVGHILCYKMYKTLHGMKHHTQSQSTFTFYLIKPYQPFNQTRTSTTHNQTTFSLCFYIYSHI